ncbi:MAG: nucleotidyltransferase domain-containing protein [bacterium]
MQNNFAVAPKYSDYLNDNERKALSELREKINEKYPGTELILYGSKARGDYREDSDIDLLIVINDKHNIDKDISFEELEKLYFLAVDKKINNEILSIIVDIELKHDIFIDWQIKNKSYLQTGLAQVVPLYKNIKREGIEL